MSELEDKTIIETLLLTSRFPVGEEDVAASLGYRPDLRRVVDELNAEYADRAIQIVETPPGRWSVRTRPELSDYCRSVFRRQPRISKAGYETLSVIAYYQPVTRSEIERIRGVSLSPGILESLIYLELVNLGPRRSTPGNPMTFVTGDRFLLTFNLRSLDDLPERDELRSQGLLSAEGGLTGRMSELMSPSRDD